LAIINLAGLCCPEGKHLRLAVGACHVTPLLFEFDELYSSGAAKEDVTEQVLEKVMGTIRPISDVRASKDYRQEMVEHFVLRALNEILG
jgi:CO/xanthine dehydrogenase FAD-binding subunit